MSWKSLIPTTLPPRPLLCLPGLLGDARIFRPLSERLRGRALIALDLPPGTPFDVASAVSAAIRARAAGPVHLLTGSWGGLAALCLNRGQIASLTVVATLPHPRFYPRWMTPLRRALTPLPAPLVEAAYRQHLARSLARDGIPPALAEALVARGLSRALLLSRLKYARCRDIPRASAPTLWLSGRGDPQVTWTAHEVRTLHPGAETASVPGGHRPYASHPAALIARLTPWWSARDSTPPGR